MRDDDDYEDDDFDYGDDDDELQQHATAENRLAALLGKPAFRFDDSDAMREHLALLLLAMATEDGELADEELAVVRRVLGDNPLFGAQSREIERCLQIAFDVLRDEHEYAERLRRALSRVLTRDQDGTARELVAAMILTIVHADGVESLYEADFGQALLDHLEIDPERVPWLLEHVVVPFLEHTAAS